MLLTNHSAPAGHVTPCSPLIGSRFQNICSADRQYNIDSISAVSELMDTMANLFGSVDVFGSFDEAKSRARIQDGKEYVRNVVVSQETHGEFIYGDTSWFEDDCPDIIFPFSTCSCSV